MPALMNNVSIPALIFTVEQSKKIKEMKEVVTLQSNPHGYLWLVQAELFYIFSDKNTISDDQKIKEYEDSFDKTYQMILELPKIQEHLWYKRVCDLGEFYLANARKVSHVA